MTTKQTILTLLGSFFLFSILNASLVFGQSHNSATEESEPSVDMESVNNTFVGIREYTQDLASTLADLKGFRKSVQDPKAVFAIEKIAKEIEMVMKTIDQRIGDPKKFINDLQASQNSIKDKTAELKKIEGEANSLAVEVIKKVDQLMKSSTENEEAATTDSENDPWKIVKGNLTKKSSELDQFKKTIQDKKVLDEIKNAKKEISEVLNLINQKEKDSKKISKEIEAAQKNIQDSMAKLEKIEKDASNFAINMTEKANQLMAPPKAETEVTQPQQVEVKQPLQIPTVKITDEQKNEVRNSMNQIAWKLFSKSGNTPICPYSAAVVLNMLREGADGGTAAELEKFFGTKLKGNQYFAGMKVVEDSKSPSMNVYSMVMFAKDYNPTEQFSQFVHGSKGFINDDVVIANADFASKPLEEMAEMNKWFSNVTKGDIEKVFTEISPQTRAVMANVTLLDVNWIKHFDKGEKADFLLKNGQKKKVTMMNVTWNVMYGKDKDCEIVVLPYRNNMAMVIILPKDLKTLEQIQTQKDANWFMNSLKKTNWKYGKVTMPPFKAGGDTNMIPLFSQLGLKNTFSTQANFRNIFGHDSIMVDQFLQSVVIDVNEVGTKAKAATAVTMIPRGAMRNPEFEIEINRPFVYAIIDNLAAKANSMILFIGVMDGSNLEVEP